MPLRHTLNATTVLMFAMAVVNAADSSHRVTWNEFSMRVTPRDTIRMVLPDGTEIEGKPLEFKPDGVQLRITGTANKQKYPKGNAAIPREWVSVVQVRTPRQRGKQIGTLVPIAVGAALLLAGGAANKGSDDVYGYIIYGSAIMGVGGPAGFLVGRAIDRRFEQFVILPEPNQTESRE